MIAKSLPYILLLGSIYGTTLIASRFSIGQFNPIVYIGLRLTIASLGYLILYLFSFQKRSLPTNKHLWKHASLLGVFGTAIPMSFIVLSLQYQSSGLTAVLIATSPALTVLLAHFFLHDEPLTRRKIIGSGIALVGALLLVLMGESGLPDIPQTNPSAYLLVMVAMLFGSIMIIYARRFMRDLDSFDVGAIRNISAAIVLLPISIFVIGIDLSQVDQSGYIALGWASIVGTFAGMLLEFYVIKRFGATSAAMAAYIIPVVAGIGGVLLLKETFTSGMFLGMAFVLVGIAVINRASLKPDLPTTEAV